TIEPGIMNVVNEATSLPVPTVLAVDFSTTAIPYPYHITSRAAGQSLAKRYPDMALDDQIQVVHDAGQYLGKLHDTISFDHYGELITGDSWRDVRVKSDDSWSALLGRRMSEWIDALDGGQFSDLMEAFGAIREERDEHLEASNISSRPALLHFDYRPSNVVISRDTITGILDWEYATAGHAEYDFFKFEKNFLLANVEDTRRREWLRPYLYRGYRKQHSLDPGWQARRDLYRVVYKLESFASFDRWTEQMTESERDEM
ncbi:MAG: phosphotransferase, partial [Halobacteriaceae archaeon]